MFDFCFSIRFSVYVVLFVVDVVMGYNSFYWRWVEYYDGYIEIGYL